MASEVPVFPTFSMLVLTLKPGNPGRQGNMENREEKYVNREEERDGEGEGALVSGAADGCQRC